MAAAAPQTLLLDWRRVRNAGRGEAAAPAACSSSSRAARPCADVACCSGALGPTEAEVPRAHLPACACALPHLEVLQYYCFVHACAWRQIGRRAAAWCAWWLTAAAAGEQSGRAASVPRGVNGRCRLLFLLRSGGQCAPCTTCYAFARLWRGAGPGTADQAAK